jgi:undecaprenyl diphosphate synthase
MQEIMELTESNNKLKLNICFAYSSTYELENAIENIVSLSLNHSFNPETLNTESFK